MVFVEDLGLMEYAEAWAMQENLLKSNLDKKAAQRVGDTSADTSHKLLILEHPPVYTLGKSGHEENVLISADELVSKNIAFYKTNRGGDITFHGPGQLVAYPLIDLEKFKTDIGWYLRSLEQVVIDLLSSFGIQGERSKGETGVWIDPSVEGKARKICAMGVRCSRWLTMHGLALNVNTELSYFDHIIPCGIRDKKVTSMATELGQAVSIDEVKSAFMKAFANVFEVDILIASKVVPIKPSVLGVDIL